MFIYILLKKGETLTYGRSYLPCKRGVVVVDHHRPLMFTHPSLTRSCCSLLVSISVSLQQCQQRMRCKLQALTELEFALSRLLIAALLLFPY